MDIIPLVTGQRNWRSKVTKRMNNNYFREIKHMNKNVNVNVDAAAWRGELRHTWNYIGYDECNFTHTPGGIELIKKLGQLEKPY